MLYLPLPDSAGSFDDSFVRELRDAASQNGMFRHNQSALFRFNDEHNRPFPDTLHPTLPGSDVYQVTMKLVGSLALEVPDTLAGAELLIDNRWVFPGQIQRAGNRWHADGCEVGVLGYNVVPTQLLTGSVDRSKAQYIRQQKACDEIERATGAENERLVDLDNLSDKDIEAMGLTIVDWEPYELLPLEATRPFHRSGFNDTNEEIARFMFMLGWWKR